MEAQPVLLALRIAHGLHGALGLGFFCLQIGLVVGLGSLFGDRSVIVVTQHEHLAHGAQRIRMAATGFGHLVHQFLSLVEALEPGIDHREG